ncbi:hypothetical protein [Treponema sp. Marseille-Q4523]|uniref:hypothetical protein n=1 Tax=Treponema TaxID=157 RepID=UPI001961185B|nr:hypothetical protein [Treponema sp. Marseille-Q4523]MBM7022288.1 hypothetical protein [Treponema sp. Marseille-Q4523]
MGGKEIEKDDSKPVLYRLVMRTVLFFALFLFSLLVFYAIGNYQNFLDENQYVILSAASLASIVLFVFSVWGFAVSLFYALKKDSPRRALYIVSAAVMIFTAAFGFVCMFASRLIDFLAAGM